MQPCKCIHLSKRIHFGCKESTAWSQRTANRCFRAIPLLVFLLKEDSASPNLHEALETAPWPGCQARLCVSCRCSLRARQSAQRRVVDSSWTEDPIGEVGPLRHLEEIRVARSRSRHVDKSVLRRGRLGQVFLLYVATGAHGHEASASGRVIHMVLT